jgi:hypothetical protein
MFLGVDAAGAYRLISSRKSINGPTFGDYAGRSVLNGCRHVPIRGRFALYADSE